MVPRTRRATLPAAVTVQAGSAAQRPVIEATALHIHFHGLSAADAAAPLRAGDERAPAGGEQAAKRLDRLSEDLAEAANLIRQAARRSQRLVT